MTDEPTYTLAEARLMVAREQCDRDGHELVQTRVEAAGRTLRRAIHCDRCQATFTENPRG